MTTAPQPKKRVSRQGLELIKSFEGLRRRAARLPNGRFVVGYGHIRSTREGAEIAPEDAEALLRYDLLPIEAALNEWALAPLTQNQFDALVSFAFNIGLASFRRSDVLRRINEGDLLRASAAMDTWRRVDLDGEPVIVDALVRRRAVEKALFLTPPGGQVPAPSAVLRPRVDTEAYSSVLLRRPEEIRTPFDGDDAVALRSEPTDQVGAEPETDEPELEFGPELVVSETTLIVPPGPDPELEPELVITETTVFVAPEEEPEAAAEDELPFTPDAELDPDFPAATEPAPEPEPEPEPSLRARASARARLRARVRARRGRRGRFRRGRGARGGRAFRRPGRRRRGVRPIERDPRAGPRRGRRRRRRRSVRAHGGPGA